MNARIPGLEKPSIALLCVLLLRGAQTLGELRQRTERLHAFPDLESIEASLNDLINHPDGPLVVCLPAGAGRRVAQYAQLLTGEPTSPAAQEEIIIAPVPAPVSAEDQAWRQRMEMEIESLKAQLTKLKIDLGVAD